MSTTENSTRRRIGIVMTYFLGVVLIGSAIAKFLAVPKVAEQMAALGFYGGKLVLIAALELASAALFLFERTRATGLLLLSTYLGGAIAVHISHNQYPAQPAIVLALIWLAVWLREPQFPLISVKA